MKGFNFAIEIVIAIILAIIVLAFYLNFVFNKKIETGSYQPPKKIVNCKTNSDCQPQLCISINNQPSFCGCLEDSDCYSGKCIYNKCSL